MYKYEEEIQKRIEEFNWEEEYKTWNFSDDKETTLKITFSFFKTNLSQYACKVLARDYTYDEHGIYKKETDTLPVMSMPVADTSNLPHKNGVYFIGMIGVNPDGQKYHLVKVGYSSDIHDRVAQYASYNPMLYIGGYVNPASEEHEKICHKYLEKRAIARAQNTKEWYYVNEEMYYELCNIFSNRNEFIKIALGMVE